MQEESMQVAGKCHCGKITYRAVIDPGKVSVCHCTDCQMFTGSAYRTSVPAGRATFELLTGQPRIYVKTAESGAQRAQAFCADCGTPVYSSAVNDPPTFSLRVGCLDQRALLPPRKQIWCRSAFGWADDLSKVPRMERQ
jgi:hypothetical protein